MSWVLRELAKWRRSNNKPFEHVDVELSDMRKAIGLKWFFGPGDEQLSPKKLGGIIDDCLVECISDLLLLIKQGGAGIKEFELTMSLVEEGTRKDLDLNAYAATLPVDSWHGRLKPASESYLVLAKRYAVYGGKRPVSKEEALRFAKALLGKVMKENWEGYDWDIKGYSQFCASQWWRYRNPYELLMYIDQSPWNPAAWDTLMLICEYAAKSGMVEIERLPDALLHWYLGAKHGHPKRPDMARGPRNRRQAHGYKIRNNEIHHAVDLLCQVGVPMRAACYAVAKATHFAERYVRRICGKPQYWTLEDIRLEMESRFTPSS